MGGAVFVIDMKKVSVGGFDLFSTIIKVVTFGFISYILVVQEAVKSSQDCIREIMNILAAWNVANKNSKDCLEVGAGCPPNRIEWSALKTVCNRSGFDLQLIL